MEKTIFEGLLHNNTYYTKVGPFLKPEYFTDPQHKVIFDLIQAYEYKYSVVPTIGALRHDLLDRKDLPEPIFREAMGIVDGLSEDCSLNTQWLIDKTEAFCKDRAIYNAVTQSINILDGDDKKRDRGVIPGLLAEALSIEFDTKIGIDYKESIQTLWDYYNRKESKIPFNLEVFDRVTKGGLRKKTLTIFMASTGGGKTIMMCHLAADAMTRGKNVLYITMEMAEEMITQRIDANRLQVTMDQLSKMDFETYKSKKEKLIARSTGNLIIKEYPTAGASASNFRALLEELRVKKKFVPDLVMVDYINICKSSRLRDSDSSSHTYPKAIAEEIRSLAIEYDFAAVSATQMNRQGYKGDDPDLTQTSESMGLPVTADLFFALSTSDELEALEQIRVTQLKNRFGDINKPKHFSVGLNKEKMEFFDVEESAQTLSQGGHGETKSQPREKFRVLNG